MTVGQALGVAAGSAFADFVVNSGPRPHLHDTAPPGYGPEMVKSANRSTAATMATANHPICQNVPDKTH
jgi:hypothetical protein